MDTIRALILSPLLGGPAYLAFASLLTGCSIGLPFSSDIILITGGVLAGTGIFELKKTIVLAFVAILAGDSIAFFVGRKYGRSIIERPFFRRFCPPERFEEISRFLTQNASKFIFSVRFTPGMRSVIFLTAGVVGVPAETFLKMNSLSTSLYVSALISLSYAAANNAEVLIAQVQLYNRVIAFTIVALIVAFMLHRRRKRLGAPER